MHIRGVLFSAVIAAAALNSPVDSALAAGLLPDAVDDTFTMIGDLDLDITRDIVVNDNPGDGPVTVSIVTPPTNGIANVLTDPVNFNKLFYKPNVQFTGNDTIVYQLRDADGDTDTATVTVAVVPRGTCANDTAQAAPNAPVVVDVLGNDTEFSPADTTVVISIAPTTGTAVVNIDNTVTYTPVTDFGGSVDFIYDVTQTSPTPLGAACLVTVAVDDLPIATDDTALIRRDQVRRQLAVINNDTGLADEPYQLDITSGPTQGTAVVDGSTNPDDFFLDIFYTPPAGFAGFDSLSYRITDANGDSAAADVTIIVGDPGSCTADTAVVERNTPVTVNVLANDAAFPFPVTALAVRVPPFNGTAVVNPEGTITYTPDLDTGGADIFVYVVANAANQGAACQVTVTVDDLPVAVDDSLTVEINSALDLDVLANDTEGANTPTAITVPAETQHGTAAVTTIPVVGGGTRDLIRYTPDPDFVGYDSVAYEITDADGDRDSAILSLTVVGNATPSTRVDVFRLVRDASKELDVLLNDRGLGNRPLTLEIVVEPVHGRASVITGPKIQYTPDPGYTGVAEACVDDAGNAVGVCANSSESLEFCTDDSGELIVSCALPGGDRIRYRVTDSDGESAEEFALMEIYPAAVTDEGGSALGTDGLAVLVGAGAARRRLRKKSLRDR